MIDIKIGRIRIGLVAQEHAELYKCGIENISSNNFLSDLSRELRNTLHSLSSSTLASLNEGIVLPM
jgi:hypothetical protein